MTPLSDLSTDLPPPRLKVEEPLQFTIGAASPLWLMFAGAAATGAAYWWMTRWIKPVNLEAILGEAAKAAPSEPEPPPALETAVAAEIALEPVTAALEAVEEPIRPVLDPEPTPIVEAAAPEVEVAPEPVAPKPASKLKAPRAPLPPEA